MSDPNFIFLSRTRFLSLVFFVLLFILAFMLFSHDIKNTELQVQVDELLPLDLFESRNLYWIHHLLALGPVLTILIVYPIFGTRLYFFRKWTISLVLCSVFFILWDYMFARIGIWGFNENYIRGWLIFGFPIEEIIWFFVIGICSLFVQELVEQRIGFPKLMKTKAHKIIIGIGILFLISTIMNRALLYTGMVCLINFGIILLYFQMGKYEDYLQIIYGFVWLIIPMVIFDGILTGMFTHEALVQYEPEEFLRIRLITIPIEDFGFGLAYMGGISWIRLMLIKYGITENYAYRK